MQQAFLDYYRCPDQFGSFRLSEGVSSRGPGYFQFGKSLCYGVSTDGEVKSDGQTCYLPFDLTDVVTNLRHERYLPQERQPAAWKAAVRAAYYLVRPLLPVRLRRPLQRAWLKNWDQKSFPRWPVDLTVDQLFEEIMLIALRNSSNVRIPFIWFWPEGKSSCAIMTHDVETGAGLRFADELMSMNDSFGIKSSFQLIPDARYHVSSSVIDQIRRRGFEVNVHDLKHDGRLFQRRDQFPEKARQINEHVRRFGSDGFRSAVLYRNLEWYDAFQFSYDMSIPNVGHLDPQPGGCCTVMPFFVNRILELPLTTTQDYSLFNILGSYSTDLWRQQIDLIRAQHGLISFNIHPDYLNTPPARNTYLELLRMLSTLRSTGDVWIPLPGEVDKWWRERHQMRLMKEAHCWKIEGPGSERARIAYATLAQDKISYSFN